MVPASSIRFGQMDTGHWQPPKVARCRIRAAADRFFSVRIGSEGPVQGPIKTAESPIWPLFASVTGQGRKGKHADGDRQQGMASHRSRDQR
jgi:hypothetical protein